MFKGIKKISLIILFFIIGITIYIKINQIYKLNKNYIQIKQMEGKSMKSKEEQKKDSKDKDKKQPKQEKLVRKIYIIF